MGGRLALEGSGGTSSLGHAACPAPTLCSLSLNCADLEGVSGSWGSSLSSLYSLLWVQHGVSPQPGLSTPLSRSLCRPGLGLTWAWPQCSGLSLPFMSLSPALCLVTS